MNSMQTWSSGKGSNPCIQRGMHGTELWLLLICSRWIWDCSNSRNNCSSFLAFTASNSSSFLTFAAFLAWPFAFFLDGIASQGRNLVVEQYGAKWWDCLRADQATSVTVRWRWHTNKVLWLGLELGTQSLCSSFVKDVITTVPYSRLYGTVVMTSLTLLPLIADESIHWKFRRR